MLEEIHQLLISFSCFGSTEVDLFFLHLAKAPCVSSHFLYWVEKVLLNRKEGINGGSLCVFLHARIMALLAWLPNVWILALYTDVPVGKLQLMMDHILFIYLPNRSRQGGKFASQEKHSKHCSRLWIQRMRFS